MSEEELMERYWVDVAKTCRDAARRFPSFHPDANFFRLAQQIAEEQAGLRKRPASLTPLEEYGFDSSSH